MPAQAMTQQNFFYNYSGSFCKKLCENHHNIVEWKSVNFA